MTACRPDHTTKLRELARHPRRAIYWPPDALELLWALGLCRAGADDLLADATVDRIEQHPCGDRWFALLRRNDAVILALVMTICPATPAFFVLEATRPGFAS